MATPDQPMPDAPRWREDFPIDWDNDAYITRRELLKFLTLGSALLAGGSLAIALLGRSATRSQTAEPRMVIGKVSAIANGGSLLFRYPTDQDPCILLRGQDGVFKAYSQVCTHLSCAVISRPETHSLYCPCHHGSFDADTGRPTGGPPTRPLPRIKLQLVGNDIVAIGKEV